MPRPVGRELTYRPGLDGVRAIAVALVVSYHLGVAHVAGGLLGVGMFFTLSGYLITSILLRSWRLGRGLDLRDFWVRRARRLLPALVLLLVVVLAATAITDAHQLTERARQSFFAVVYAANWSTISSGLSYFQRFAGPGPLDHLWSLAIEEQFYLVWPVLLLVLLRFTGRDLVKVAKITVVLAAVSFVLLALYYHPGFDNTRAYEGTDTRAGGLLVGAALALVWRPSRRAQTLTIGARVILDACGAASLVVIAVLVTSTGDYSSFLYRGGLLVLSLATAVLVAIVVHPAALTGRLLGIAPLRWVGERSYGIYLWHLPVIAFVPAAPGSAPSLARGTLQVILIVALAALSWVLLENPIRQYGLAGAVRRALHPERAPLLVGRRALPPVTRFATLALVPTLTLALVYYVAPGDSAMATGSLSLASAQTDRPAAEPRERARDTQHHTRTGSVVVGRRRTTCQKVVHVGDSTSVGLVSATVLPRARDRIPAQYARVGVRDVVTDISGARSIVETYDHEPNAETAVKSRMDKGYDGCWVIAMGTNDTANQVVGGSVSYADRIDRLMDRIGDRPTLWLTLRTLRTSGPYAESHMRQWNDALVAACRRYPDMRVYDWASQAQSSWFISDRIHFTSDGYRRRGKRIARALATAFPVHGSAHHGCLVTP